MFTFGGGTVECQLEAKELGTDEKLNVVPDADITLRQHLFLDDNNTFLCAKFSTVLERQEAAKRSIILPTILFAGYDRLSYQEDFMQSIEGIRSRNHGVI